MGSFFFQLEYLWLGDGQYTLLEGMLTAFTSCCDKTPRFISGGKKSKSATDDVPVELIFPTISSFKVHHQNVNWPDWSAILNPQPQQTQCNPLFKPVVKTIGLARCAFDYYFRQNIISKTRSKTRNSYADALWWRRRCGFYLKINCGNNHCSCSYNSSNCWDISVFDFFSSEKNMVENFS